MSDNDPVFEQGTQFAHRELVEARESLGLTVEMLQRELRLTPKVIQAIEAGDLQAIGQPVFARGYIRAYCKRVGLDANRFVIAYDAVVQDPSVKKAGSRARNLGKVSAKPQNLALSSRRKSGGLKALVKVVALVCLILGGFLVVKESGLSFSGLGLDELIGMEQAEDSAGTNSLTIPGVAPAPVPADNVDSGTAPVSSESVGEPDAVGNEPSVESAMATPGSQIETAEAESEVVTVQPQTEVASQPFVAESPTEISEQASDVAAQQAAESVQVASPVDDRADGRSSLIITFSEVSWVNIKDSTGESLFNGLAERGRTLELSGLPPVTLVIGRADAVKSLSFNGVVVDLAPHTRKNVARLTLPL